MSLYHNTRTDGESLNTLVKRTKIELTVKSIDKILHIPYKGLDLREIDMSDNEILSKIFLLGQGLPMANNKLQHTARLIGRILAYNIYPKTDSFNYFSHDLVVCVYATMGGLEVNWARIIYNNITKQQTSFLPSGAFLTHIFKKFHVDVSSKINVIRSFELVDHSVLTMIFIYFQQSLPSLSSQEPPSSQASLSTSRLSQSTHFDDAYRNTLTAEVMELKTQQASMVEFQATLSNQGLLMKHFESMLIRMDHMYEDQQKIL